MYIAKQLGFHSRQRSDYFSATNIETSIKSYLNNNTCSDFSFLLNVHLHPVLRLNNDKRWMSTFPTCRSDRQTKTFIILLQFKNTNAITEGKFVVGFEV